MKREELGRASLRPGRAVMAGEYAMLTLTYGAGPHGIDDNRHVKIALRDMCDAGKLQWEDAGAANYVSARTTGAARVVISREGWIRPWRKGIVITVMDGYLAQGDRIGVVFGDRSGGVADADVLRGNIRTQGVGGHVRDAGL